MTHALQAPLAPLDQIVGDGGESATRTSGPARRRVLSQVRAVCALHGIGPDQLEMFLRDDASSNPRVANVASVFEGGASLDVSNMEICKVAAEIERRTGHPIATNGLEPRRSRLARRAADCVGAVLGLASAYVVIGGLLNGSSELLPGAGGLMSASLFAATLTVLALFEALHVCVVQLKTSDLGSLESSHPRATRLQRQFATDEGVQRFLAGRQIVVIVTVFFVAGLSSFRDMQYLPFTSIEVPTFVAPLLWVGAPGAFFTLWLGQLAPQFFATRCPVKLMNLRIAEAALKVAMALEAIGIARPGFWISRGDPEGIEIPTSPAVRWAQSAAEIDGYGTVSLSREWTVTEGGATLDALATTAFFGRARGSFSDANIMVPAGVCELGHFSSLVKPEARTKKPLLPLPCSDDRLRSGDRLVGQSVVPAVGAIEPGDILLSAVHARYENESYRDAVLVDSPARSLAFRVEIGGDPTFVPDAKICAHKVGADTTDLIGDAAPITVRPALKEDGSLAIEHSVMFPEVGTLYVLSWQVDY